jgi:curved DNA-binding protein CbpA
VPKDYYGLLEIQPDSSPDDVKRAFRSQIARYHPDKVQHLGREFQDMAADRAAELTEAYRILSDAGRRAEYDRARLEAGGAAASASPPPEPSSAPTPAATEEQARPRPAEEAPRQPPPEAAETSVGKQFTQERASRDQYVRKATVGRLRQALEAVGGDYDDAPSAPGFDVALVPKGKLFGRGKGPKLLGRFVTLVDRQAIADVWAQAGKWSASDEVCVFLLGSSMAPAGELAGEIATQRRRQPKMKLTLIPVDARNWDAHMPLDAPPIAKSLLTRLKSGT